MALIYSKPLKQEIWDKTFMPDWCKTLVSAVIDAQPEADAEPVSHAHWIETTEHVGDVDENGWKCIGTTCGDEEREFKCSRCGLTVYCGIDDLLDNTISEIFPYCHCGAKMDEEVNNATDK